MKTKFHTSILIIGLIILVAIIWAAFQVVEKEKEEVAKQREMEEMVEEEKVIKIGAILPLTGWAAPFGQETREGIELAVEDVNIKGGINQKPLMVLFEDSQADPKTGISAIQNLVQIHKVKVVITAITGVTMAILPITNESSVFIITSATHPDITKKDNLAVRNYLTAAQEAETMASFVINALQFNKIAILHLNDEAFIAYKDSIVEIYKQNHGEILLTETYENGVIDFKTQLLKVKEIGPQALYIGGWTEIAYIIKQARELGIEAQILCSSSVESLEILSITGDLAEGIIYTAPSFDIDNQEGIQFKNKFIQKYGRIPKVTSAEFYDSIMILTKAIRAVGYNDAVSIREAVLNTKNYQGVMGKIGYLSNGDIDYPIIFKTIKNGQFVPYEEGEN